MKRKCLLSRPVEKERSPAVFFKRSRPEDDGSEDLTSDIKESSSEFNILRLSQITRHLVQQLQPKHDPDIFRLNELKNGEFGSMQIVSGKNHCRAGWMENKI